MAGRWSPFVAGIALMVAVSAPATAQDPLDLNKATREQLVAHPGIGQAFADKIIAARPFKMRSELVARGIMPATQYLKIKKGLTPTAEDAAAE
ncbi:MAG: helix-hairpin-helix domain-containing protein, partial [Gemmatimonadetes bacterium]|nr:helix-hairpin-helix domain-containing protein [Gemmatimonadota bacterium]